MLTTLKKLFSLLAESERSGLFKIQLLLIFMAIFELIGIASIFPFMALVGNQSILYEPGPIAEFFKFSQIADPNNFLMLLAVSVFLIILSSSLFSIFASWKLAMFGNKVGANIGNRLFCFYMHQPWLYHSDQNSSTLTSKIANESYRLTHFVINPVLLMNARLISAVCICTMLLIFNPLIAISGAFFFGSAYYLIFSFASFYLDRNGKIISHDTQARFRLMSEGFGGIKDTLLLGRQSKFIDRFKSVSNNIAHANGLTTTLISLPRYLVELLLLTAVILLVVFLLITNEENMLSILSVYALAGLKLLPAFQQVYSSLSLIKGNISAFTVLNKDLIASNPKNLATKIDPFENKKIQFLNTIKFKNISFSYPKEHIKVINEVSLTIKKNTCIGIVGSSGSGKSTTVDLLLGLLEPSEGEIVIDSKVLNKTNIRKWQNIVGYVPQDIYLSDLSIKENIAFGLPKIDISNEAIDQALELANLKDFVNSLPESANTVVGERGVQLSGGQRQRIGIARALYHEAEVLILDEATSSLDGLTEKSIMDNINSFTGKKTIIMVAHRLATVRNCDDIFLFHNGEIIDQGSFEELVLRNETFHEMSKHA
ncbi:ABC transporter ATP-binding protein/permease [Gammaproteobacteria bacterium]|nr:ABC transporter ATP-binding protein/permease [Gammaproteobacteria bacterium]